MIKPSLNELKMLYHNKDVVGLAARVPHLRNHKSKFVKFLMDSNLLKMGNWVAEDPVTYGADPEFILCKKNCPEEIVLFSSEYTDNYFGISEAEVGADYGLLEFRVQPAKSVKIFLKNLNDIHNEFESRFKKDNITILEKEAIIYNHKKMRVLESLYKGKDINYGMNRGKDVSVWSGGNDSILSGIETGVTLNAYDNIAFNKFNDELLTAGGHIHIGGSMIKILSMAQLKQFIMKLDDTILPVCSSLETEAGILRRTVYGSPGEFRIKEYGIEYRSPSNVLFLKKNLKKLSDILYKVENILFTMAVK